MNTNTWYCHKPLFCYIWCLNPHSNFPWLYPNENAKRYCVQPSWGRNHHVPQIRPTHQWIWSIFFNTPRKPQIPTQLMYLNPVFGPGIKYQHFPETLSYRARRPVVLSEVVLKRQKLICIGICGSFLLWKLLETGIGLTVWEDIIPESIRNPIFRHISNHLFELGDQLVDWKGGFKEWTGNEFICPNLKLQ